MIYRRFGIVRKDVGFSFLASSVFLYFYRRYQHKSMYHSFISKSIVKYLPHEAKTLFISTFFLFNT